MKRIVFAFGIALGFAACLWIVGCGDKKIVVQCDDEYNDEYNDGSVVLPDSVIAETNSLMVRSGGSCYMPLQVMHGRRTRYYRVRCPETDLRSRSGIGNPGGNKPVVNDSL